MTGLIQYIISLLKGLQLWVMVLPWERCVRVRAGRYTAVLEPGYHWKLPVLDKVWPVNTRLRFTSFPAQTLTTKDGKTLTIGGMVGFRITDPLVAMQNLQQPETSCAALVQASISEYVPVRTMDELDKSELELEALTQLHLQAPGFAFEFVSITDWALVRAIRLLQESWRPETRADRDPYNN